MILQPGRNCQGTYRANRFTLLVDGQAYFAAFRDSLLAARKSAILVGWDFHSRTALLRPGSSPDPESTLRKSLEQALDQAPDLHVHLLAWDYAMLYALEREPLAMVTFAWRAGPRLHFHMDGEHPLGASHHQKITVLDDAAGYVGGLDLTQHRWDTPEHRPGDTRRQAPTGVYFPPFHDMQGLVDGEAARALGRLARRRWKLATGDQIPEPEQGADTWPEGVEPDLRDVDVALARTEPRYKGREEVREIENLYIDAIAASKKSIYIENQYLTASRVVDALVERMAGDAPPEVVAVLPRHCSGWLEEQIMHALRADAVQRIQQADRHGRFRVFYPAVGQDSEQEIKVHAKCMFVDDRFVTFGSANLSNRSMGLDTECNLALEAGNQDTEKGLRALRLRLLAEHMGREEAEVGRALEETGLMLETISRLNTHQRRLVPLEEEIARDNHLMDDVPVELARRLDPEQPVAVDVFLDEVSEESPELQRGAGQLTLALTLVLPCVLAVLWRHSPWGSEAVFLEIAGWLAQLRASSLTPAVLLGAYALGGVAFLPATLLIALTMLLYPSLQASFWALAGCLLGALAGYFRGRLGGAHLVRAKARPGLNRLGRLLAKDTMAALVLARMLPLTPFWLANLAAGASRIRLDRFLAGTALGMAPGILALAVFAAGLKRTLLSPSWGTAALLLLMAAGIVAAMALLKRRLQPRPAPRTSDRTADRKDHDA